MSKMLIGKNCAPKILTTGVSLFQTCFMTPELREAVFAVQAEEIEYEPLQPEGGLDVPDTKDRILFMPCELQRLFAYIQVRPNFHRSCFIYYDTPRKTACIPLKKNEEDIFATRRPRMYRQ
jgi:hypothetical protein